MHFTQWFLRARYLKFQPIRKLETDLHTGSHFPKEKKFTNHVKDLLSNISAHFRLVPLFSDHFREIDWKCVQPTENHENKRRIFKMTTMQLSPSSAMKKSPYKERQTS